MSTLGAQAAEAPKAPTEKIGVSNAVAAEASSVRSKIRVYFVAEKVQGGAEHGHSGYGVRVQVFGMPIHHDLGSDNKTFWASAIENANKTAPLRAGGKNNLVDGDEKHLLDHADSSVDEAKLAPELVIAYTAGDKNSKQKQLHLKRKTEDAKAKDSLFSQFKGIPMTPEDGDGPAQFLGRIDIYESDQRILNRDDLELYPRRFFFNYARPLDADGVADSKHWPGLQVDDLAVIARGYLLATVMVLRAGLRETLATLEKAVPAPDLAEAR